MDLRKLDGFARMHLGLITRASAAAVGVNRSAWYRAIRRGELQPVQPNVARIYGQPSSRQQAILAAVLALASAGDNPAVVLASHRSAAFLLGLQRPATDPIDITVDSLHARELDGVIVHRTTRPEDLRPTHRHRVPCTNLIRTLVDLGAVDPDAVPEALEHLTVARRLTPTMVARLIDRHKGRPGVVPLRRALDDWPLGDTIPDSELEIAMAHLLERANLPPATFHADVAGYEVDFLIDGTPVVVECDGWTTHVARPDQWEFDLTRDARIHATGHVVLRRSRRQVVFEPEATARLIRDLLDRPLEPRSADDSTPD